MQARSDQRLLCLSLKGLPEQEAAIWIDMVSSGWRNHPKALPLQIVGLSLIGLLIAKSSLAVGVWLPLYACMILVCVAVILPAFRFRRIQLTAANYQPWRLLLLGWRSVHAVSGGALCALLYGGLDSEWQLPLLITVVVFTYGLTFYAIEDFGLAMVGTMPIVLSMLAALLVRARAADHFIAVLLVAAGINGWLAGRAISLRLFEAARTRQRNAVLVNELAREVEEVTRAKAQADLANREKSEFFAAASHDLRQPLYSLQLLSDHLRKQLSLPHHIEVADKLSGALTSMRHLFERMFDVARLDAQKVSCQPRHVSVQDLFASLDHEFALACREKGLRWSVQSTDDWIWADPVLAQRMLRNLLENALRYTDQGEVRLRARSRGGLVHCQVWDTGMGIARADQARVFNDYFQVQNAARRAQDGLGLGLGVVRRLVALTGARIALQSRLGRGSCFDLAFERGQAQSIEPVPVALDESLDATENECVLVIEDQASVRDAVLMILQHGGYQAFGGDQAMDVAHQAAVQQAWPRAVVCDYRLGASYTGFDAIAQLRHEFGDEMPAILVTGDLAPQIQQRADQLGIRVLHKPIDRSQLLTVLREAIRSSQG